MKKILVLYALIGFVVLNILSFQEFYFNVFGNYYYSNGNFENALKYYKKSTQKEAILNQANTLYKEKKYTNALPIYLSILTKEKNNLNFEINYNVGNTYYKMSLSDVSKQNDYLQQAVNYYSAALDIKYDEQAKQNLDFVLKKLKENKKEDEKKNNQEKSDDKKQPDENKQNDSANNSGSGSQSDKSSQSGSGRQSQSQKNESGSGKIDQNNTGSGMQNQAQTGSGAGEGKTQSGSIASEKTSKPELSKDQEAQLKAYQEQLKQEQKQNQSDLGKVYPEQNSNDPFDNFFNNDPFFDNSLLNKDDSKKDW